MTSDSPRSRAEFESARRVMPGGVGRGASFFRPHPVYATSGSGCRFTDLDGVERIDFNGNHASLIHGYAHPEVTAAVIEQVSKGTCFPVSTDAESALASTICERVASVDSIRFVNTGTEAVMIALQLARAVTGRAKIAKCEGAYHGMHDYVAVNLGAPPINWAATNNAASPAIEGITEGVLSDIVIFPFNDRAAAEVVLSRHADELAAIVVDMMPNRAGQIPIDAAYLRWLREFCTAHGVALIIDEVLTFRLGFHGAQGVFGVDADITTFGKIIGGGFPVGAVGGKDLFMAALDPEPGPPRVPQSGTFSANPVTVAGAATMRLLTGEAIDALAALGERLRQGLREAFARSPTAGQVTGMGSLAKIHLTGRDIHDYASAYPRGDESEKLARLWRTLFDDGFYITPNGMLVLSTPMGESEIDALTDAVARALPDL